MKPEARIAVIGDLSGHLAPLLPTLQRCGVDFKSGRVPDDLTVIQVGDLVHKGPDSDAIVAFVDRVMKGSGERWVQLIGNHEAMHLGGPEFDGCNCSPTTIATLERWASEGQIGVAAAYEREGRETLVTHAGLGRPAWRELGRPRSAAVAARGLNTRLRTNPRSVLQAGAMLDGHPAWSQPGVVWAHGPVEVYATWWGHEPPFDQIHGHVNAYLWNQQRWADNMADELRQSSWVDESHRFTGTRIADRIFLAIDPGFTSRSASSRIFAYEAFGVLSASPLVSPIQRDILGY